MPGGKPHRVRCACCEEVIERCSWPCPENEDHVSATETCGDCAIIDGEPVRLVTAEDRAREEAEDQYEPDPEDFEPDPEDYEPDPEDFEPDPEDYEPDPEDEEEEEL